MTTRPPEELDGYPVGHFRLTTVIGTGRSAIVYRAHAGTAGERQVAVKILGEALTGDRSFWERFEQDVSLLATLGHPNLLPVLAHGTIDGLTYLAMLLAPGGTLADQLHHGPIPRDRAWPIIAALAAALAHAHDAGLTHRDVKPSNVLFDATGMPLLADFGLARTYYGFAVGSPAYMAPEQALGAPPDRRSDIYGLAAVILEMLTGRRFRPENGSDAELIREAALGAVPRPTTLAPDLPAAVDDALFRALAPEPADRPDSALALLHELSGALGVGVPALPRPAAGQAAESEAHSLEQHLLRLVENSLTPAIAIDEGSRVVGWNAAAERAFGWSRDEMVGRLLATTMIPERFREGHERGMQSYLAGGEGPVIDTVIEIVSLHKEGHEVPIELSISPAARIGHRALVVGFCRDISDEQRAAQARAARSAVEDVLRGDQSLAAAAPQLLEALGSRLGWDVAVLWMANGDALGCEGFWSSSDVEGAELERATRQARLHSGDGGCGRAWASGETVWSRDILQEAGEPRIVPALRAGLRAAAAIPIVASAGVIGVVELLGQGVRPADEVFMLRLAELGRQIGRAVN